MGGGKDLTHLHPSLWNEISCIPRMLVHITCSLPPKIIIIREVNDWEFKFNDLISNHYAMIREINKLLSVCRKRKIF